MLISVIIPVYQVSINDLQQCLNSILRQALIDETEILLVFDGKQDEYDELLKQYENQVRVIVKDHGGVSAARNRGIAEAKGKWILFIDADDWLGDDCFGLFEQMLRTEENSIIMFDYILEYADGRCVPRMYKKLNTLAVPIERQTWMAETMRPQSGMGFGHAKFMTASVLKENQVLFSEELSLAEDAEFIIRASKYFEHFFYSDKQEYHYRINSNSAVRKFKMDYAKRYIKAMDKIKDYVVENEPQQTVICDNFILYHLLLIAVNYSFHPDHPANGIKKIKEFKKLVQLPVFRAAMQNIRYDQFSMTRKITLLLIRMKCYIGVALIAKIRHRQMGK